jgi:hypothetical protein
MTYMHQWFGALTGWAFLYGCFLGLWMPPPVRAWPSCPLPEHGPAPEPAAVVPLPTKGHASVDMAKAA